jgi:GNAT superfamily N-acetyltransferase
MIIVREAIDGDIPRILELYEELTEEKIDVSEDKIHRVFDEIAAIPNQELMVAEKDNLVVGTLFLQIVPNLSHNAHPWGILENMVVDVRYRRQGIGRLLIDHALLRCREAGCYKLQLLSHKSRTPAHEFYRSMGFDESALGFRIYF